eukprot:364951-Chlamydomonas_euryale.AAC.9
MSWSAWRRRSRPARLECSRASTGLFTQVCPGQHACPGQGINRCVQICVDVGWAVVTACLARVEALPSLPGHLCV